MTATFANYSKALARVRASNGSGKSSAPSRHPDRGSRALIWTAFPANPGTALPRGKPLRVVIAGGGVAALEATLALRALAADRVALQLVAPEPEFAYRPLAVVEPFRVGEVERFPLPRLTDAASAELRQGLVASVDPERHVVAGEGGEELSYDLLLLAVGARPTPAVANALTFRGPQDGPALAAVLEDAVAGSVRSIVFALPVEARWPLPLYELALLTGNHLTDRSTKGVAITLVTPEDAPLALFGAEASEAIRELLELRGIELRLRPVPLRFEGGAPDGARRRDRSGPSRRTTPARGPAAPRYPVRPGRLRLDGRLRARRLRGGCLRGGRYDPVPAQAGRDRHAAGRRCGNRDRGALGSPGRADALPPRPARPPPHGDGSARAQGGTRPGLDIEPLWWPPAKIVGRYLTPLLAAKPGLAETVVGPLREGAIPIEIELDPSDCSTWSPI